MVGACIRFTVFRLVLNADRNAGASPTLQVAAHELVQGTHNHARCTHQIVLLVAHGNSCRLQGYYAPGDEEPNSRLNV